MRPNISNCHALPGTLIIFEGPDGSGKTTQIKALKKMLQAEGRKVTISSWKSAPILGDFMKANEALKKVDERILPETSLFFQAGDLAYRIEREIIPAMKKNHIVILDRSTQTLIVRGLMLGMQEEQLTKGLLWWRNSIYKELFDKAITIHIKIGLEESLKRLSKRGLSENISSKKKGDHPEGTLLALDFINNLIYSPEGKKMTRNDKKAIIRKTQNNIIETYNKIFESDTKSHPIILNGEDSVKQVEEALKRQLIDQII
ncbi:deoxynucleoside kinase [Candidatus Gracilibacteria bacterium]|nr:deoxynucleoside kinase [Candidatus Gracilibacteria bacterium]